MKALKLYPYFQTKITSKRKKKNTRACFIFKNIMNFDIRDIFLNKIYKSNKFLKWYKLRNELASIHELPAGKCYLNIVKYSISIKPTLQSACISRIIGEAAAFREPTFKFSALQYALYTLK
jgi:hypothetical protein